MHVKVGISTDTSWHTTLHAARTDRTIKRVAKSIYNKYSRFIEQILPTKIQKKLQFGTHIKFFL